MSSAVTSIFVLTILVQHQATSFTLPPPPPPPTRHNQFVMPGQEQINNERLAEPPIPRHLMITSNQAGEKTVNVVDFVRRPVIDIAKPLPAPPTFHNEDSHAVVRRTGDGNGIENGRDVVIYADDFLQDDQSETPDNYDIMYNDVINCPLKSFTANNRAYFGAAFRVLVTYNSADCMTYCFQDTRCKSINFVPLDQQQQEKTRGGGKFACELNEFDQRDNPRLLIERQGATYYDRIRCDNEPIVQETRTATIEPNSVELIEKYNHINEKQTTEPTNNHLKSSPNFEIKLNRLTMLETIMKTFHKEPTID